MIPEGTKRIEVIAKPNSKTSRVEGFVDGKLLVRIKSPADKNKANKELLKLISKKTGRQARIKKGLTSREKLLEFID